MKPRSVAPDAAAPPILVWIDGAGILKVLTTAFLDWIAGDPVAIEATRRANGG